MKRLFTVIIIAMLAVFITGCGWAQSKSTSTSRNTVTPEPEENSYSVVEYDIKKIYGFNEGYSWVEYSSSTQPVSTQSSSTQSSNSQYALIDEDGYIIFTESCPGTDVINGTTACDNDDFLKIYDTDGNILYQVNNTPEDSYEVEGYADGHYAIREHVTGFSGNQYFLYLADEKGAAYNRENRYNRFRYIFLFKSYK